MLTEKGERIMKNKSYRFAVMFLTVSLLIMGFGADTYAQSLTLSTDVAELSASKLAAPTGLKCWHMSLEVTLTWNKVKGADGYSVYMYDTDAKKYKRIKSVKSNKCKYIVADEGIYVWGNEGEFSFKVRAYKKTSSGVEYGSWSKKASIIVFEEEFVEPVEEVTEPVKSEERLAAPQNLKVNSVTSSSVALEWDKVKDADKYRVEYSEKEVEPGVDNIWTVYETDKTYIVIDEKFIQGIEYIFCVNAVKNDNGKDIYSPSVSVTEKIPVFSGKLEKPSWMYVSDINEEYAVIGWNKVENANGYKYILYEGSKEKYRGTTDTNRVALTGLEKSCRYTLWVAATNGKRSSSYLVGDTFTAQENMYTLPGFARFGWKDLHEDSTMNVVKSMFGGDLVYGKTYKMDELNKILDEGKLPADEYLNAVWENGLRSEKSRREKISDLPVDIPAYKLTFCAGGMKLYEFYEVYLPNGDDKVDFLIVVKVLI